MRWLRRGLYALAGTVVILISIDLGMFKERVEVLATDWLGREFRIDGELHAQIGTSFELYAEDVYLANPAWADEEAFISARKIDFSVALWSLLKGPIDIERLEIDGVRLNIEKNAAGDASWIFAQLETEQDSDAEAGVASGLMPVILDHATILDTRISYSSPAMAEPLLFVAESLLWRIDADKLNVELSGSLNGTPVHVRKSTGPVENLLNYRDVAVEITGNIGEITIQGSAWIDDLLAPRRPRLQLDIHGPNARYLTDILSMQAITTGPLELSVSIKESGEQMIASLGGVFGEFGFNLDGRFQNIQELHNVDLNIAAHGPDIGTIIRLSGGEYTELDPFEIRGRVSRAGSAVTIDNVLVVIGASKLTVDGFFGEFPSPKGGHLSLLASGPDYDRFNRLFGMPGLLGGAFKTSLELTPNDDGRTRIQLAANAPDIAVRLESLLSLANNFEGTTLQLEISGPDIGTVASAAGIDGLPAEPFNITASVEKDPAGYLVKNLKVVVNDNVFRIDGHIGNQPLAGETNLAIDFSGTDIGKSVAALGGTAEHLPKGAYYLRGTVQKQDEKLWLRDIRAAIGDAGEYQFQVSGFLTPREQFVGSRVTVHAKGASLAALAELAGQQGVPDVPFDLSAEIRRGLSVTYIDKGLFESGNVAVEFSGHVGDEPLADDMALTFKASVPRLKNVIAKFGVGVDMLPDGDLVASGSLRQKTGKILLEQFDVAFGGAKLQLSGDIGTLPSLAGTLLAFELDGDDLSRLLPPAVAGESLLQAFAASGKVSLGENELAVEQFRANIGHTTFAGSFAFGLEPFLGRGSFNLKADSPDVYQLLPELEDVFVRQVAKMKYRGSGNWADNFWSVEHSRLELGEGYLELNGSLDGPPNFARTNLDIEWLAASVRKFSRIAGRELPDHPLQFKARLTGTADVMTLEDFDLTFGESDLHGNFTLQAGDVPAVKLDMKSRLFDISEYLPAPEEEPQAATPAADEKVIPDTPLPLDLLRSFDADINIALDQLRTRSLDIRGLELDAMVVDGALKIEKLSYITLRDGYFALSASLVPNASDGADFTLAANGKDLVMAFLAKSAEDLQQLPLFQVNAELAASGATVREIAGSMSGYVRVVGGAGREPSGTGAFFTQDFITELLGKINPFTKTDPYTNVSCTVLLLQFDNGVLDGSPALVRQTDKLLLSADTRIDLQTEKFGVDFKMSPRKGLGLSLSNLVNPYIQVTGTLGKPALVIDPRGVLIEGGAAVVTGGLTILAKSFKNRFLSEKDPCGKAVKKADEKNEVRKSDS